MTTTDTMSGMTSKEVTPPGAIGKRIDIVGQYWWQERYVVLTSYNHSCHWTAEWSCACSAMLCCYLNTVLSEHSQSTDGIFIGGSSCLKLRGAASSNVISYGVVEFIAILVPARWGAPPDQDGGRSSSRGIDKLGSTSGGWRHRVTGKVILDSRYILDSRSILR